MLSGKDLLSLIDKKLDNEPQHLQSIETALNLYKAGFNVIPVTSEGKPVSALLGVDATQKLPLVKLLEGILDLGFAGVAINDTSLPSDPNKLLYVVRAKREALDKYNSLKELVDNTVSWRRGEHVYALIIVDKEVASKLLSKQIQGEVEIKPPGLLVIAGLGVEPVKPFDFSSPTLGIKEITESELKYLLREINALREEAPPKQTLCDIVFKELDDAAVDKIKNALLEAYKSKPEYRNDIIYDFTVIAADHQVSPLSIAKIVKALIRETADAQVDERFAAFIAGLEAAGLDVKHCASEIEGVFSVFGVKLDSVGKKPNLQAKKLEEVFKEVYGESSAVLLAMIGDELNAAEYPETQETQEKVESMYDKINEVIGKLDDLINEHCGIDFYRFAELKRVESKARCIYEIISNQFEIIKVPPKDANGESVLYAAVDNLLYDIEEVVKPIVGALIAREGARKALVGEVITAAYSTPNIVPWYKINPWEYLRLANGVLDLMNLRILDSVDYYFTHRLPVKIRQEEIDIIMTDRYNIEENMIYRYWRNRFDDQNWEYLVSSLGTWLSPYRHRHIAFLIGPPGAGKSTLLNNLTRPISPIVAHASLRSITEYVFGLETLIGKQIVVYSERGETILKNLDTINNLFGESDHIVVQRKHKPAITIRSLKTAFFAMNDPPLVYEYGGQTMAAFLDRLSIIQIGLQDSYDVIPNLSIPAKEAFKFLIWCRVQLERNGWKIKKMEAEALLDYLMRSTNSALQFLSDTSVVEPDPAARVKGTELYEAYVRWCSEKGIRPMSRNNFYSIVATKYHEFTREGARWFRGLKLKILL